MNLNKTVLPKRSKICTVCGAISETFHLNYGASTCFSCRAFFRRAAISLRTKNNSVTTMKCKKNFHCAIEGATARKCRRCRFEQCLRMGMNVDQVMSEDQKKNRFKKLIESHVQENYTQLLVAHDDLHPQDDSWVNKGEKRKGRKGKTKFENLPQEVVSRVKITFKRKKVKEKDENNMEKKEQQQLHEQQQQQQQQQQLELGGDNLGSIIKQHNNNNNNAIDSESMEEFMKTSSSLTAVAAAEEKQDNSEFMSYKSVLTRLCQFKKSSLFHLNHIERSWQNALVTTVNYNSNSNRNLVIIQTLLDQLRIIDRVFVEFASHQSQLNLFSVVQRRKLLQSSIRRFRQYQIAQSGIMSELGLGSDLYALLKSSTVYYPKWFSAFVAFACLFHNVQNNEECITSLLMNLDILKRTLDNKNKNSSTLNQGFNELFCCLDRAADIFELRFLNT